MTGRSQQRRVREVASNAVMPTNKSGTSFGSLLLGRLIGAMPVRRLHSPEQLCHAAREEWESGLLSVLHTETCSPLRQGPSAKQTALHQAQNLSKHVQYMLFVKAHLSKHFNGLVKKTGLQFFRHWQEMSSTVEDAQQSEPVTLSKGRRPYCKSHYRIT